jgi:hypothetical protein
VLERDWDSDISLVGVDAELVSESFGGVGGVDEVGELESTPAGKDVAIARAAGGDV